jgi:hypothetical protein
MGRYTAESTGMNILRPIAQEKLRKDASKKKRIWSDDLEAWGFFAIDEVTKQDIFLLWCSAAPGDRLIVNDDQGNKKMTTIVGVWKNTIEGINWWIFKLIDQFGVILDLKIKENELFMQAW